VDRAEHVSMTLDARDPALDDDLGAPDQVAVVHRDHDARDRRGRQERERDAEQQERREGEHWARPIAHALAPTVERAPDPRAHVVQLEALGARPARGSKRVITARGHVAYERKAPWERSVSSRDPPGRRERNTSTRSPG
jgi:hypothetical protein